MRFLPGDTGSAYILYGGLHYPLRLIDRVANGRTKRQTARGIDVFTARPGIGKTYALRCFMNGLNHNQYQTVYIGLFTISVTEFYREFCTLLGLEASGNRTGMFCTIQERVYYLYWEKKQPLVLAGEHT